MANSKAIINVNPLKRIVFGISNLKLWINVAPIMSWVRYRENDIFANSSITLFLGKSANSKNEVINAVIVGSKPTVKIDRADKMKIEI